MRSDKIKVGPQAAPHRSLLYALGLTDEEIQKPLIGIVSSQNDIVPGHMNLDKIVDAVKQGVALAGGVPIVFPAIAVCDGIAMGHEGMKYSLVSRELIADSTEAMAIAHAFDALVMVPNCDKNVPGLLMAAARLNIPTILVSGGAMSAGIIGKKKLSLVSAFEGVGAYKAGKIDAKKLTEIEQKCCPSCGSCSGMFTANSMNCLTEVLGMGLPGNGTIPAVQSARIRLAKKAGMKVMELLEKNIRPRDIMTYDAFLNAMTVDMALGCSTNSMLHLPAIAQWEKSCGKHPTQKPLSVLSRIVLASTNSGAWILDPFTGSSTTGVAANLLGRRFLGIDKEEEFLILSQNRKKEIEHLSTFSLFRNKIKDIALLDNMGLLPAQEDFACGYDLPF